VGFPQTLVVLAVERAQLVVTHLAQQMGELVELEKQFRLHIQDHLYPQSVVAVVAVVIQDLQDQQEQLTLAVAVVAVVQVDQVHVVVQVVQV
tara:strand:- start:108 stop:383 length:276 start_codon:yes stop_codon:yes gene_type:complete